MYKNTKQTKFEHMAASPAKQPTCAGTTLLHSRNEMFYVPLCAGILFWIYFDDIISYHFTNLLLCRCLLLSLYIGLVCGETDKSEFSILPKWKDNTFIPPYIILHYMMMMMYNEHHYLTIQITGKRGSIGEAIYLNYFEIFIDIVENLTCFVRCNYTNFV